MADAQTEATIIGETILITGNLRGDEDLTVLGRVEGYVNLSRTLLIADGGIVKAEISVNNAVVSGIVVGNLTAADCIHITESGRILGNICARRVILDAGARVRGDINVGAPAAVAARDMSEELVFDEVAQTATPLALASVAQSAPTSLMERRNLAGAQGNLAIGRSGLGMGSPMSFAQASQAAMALAVKKKKVVVKKRG